jgi:general stress protein 26
MAKYDLSLTRDELDRFLESHRTVRLATSSDAGEPHVVPLWYVWLDGTMFMNSTTGNVTVRNLEADPRASALIDDGDAYEELRGAILHGRVEWAAFDPRLEQVNAAWSTKYLEGRPVPFDLWEGRVWFRLRAERVASWDFRKIPLAKAQARQGEGEATEGGSDA